MKITDHRVGNYVESGYPDDEWDLLQISPEDIEGLECGSFRAINLYDDNWILRLGFTPKAQRFTKGKFTYNMNSGWWYGKKKLPDNRIKYVHQLQNLFFALTGEELLLE